MSVRFIYPEFEVIRNESRCITCRVCERQCANEVHTYDENRKVMLSDESKCVDCQRCVSLCPTRALKIVKSDCALRENANWQQDTIHEIYKQAESGGVLLSSMGNPKPLPVYWDHILINASQVTNPPIDPLREPMETKVFLGKKSEKIRRDANGRLICRLPPQLELSMPMMFSAMSYGSISYNAHESLARAAQELGILYNTGEGGLHEDFYVYGENTVVQVASGRFGVHEEYLKAGAAVEIKMGQGAKPGIGGHLPGAKIVGDVSRTRMIPEGSDAISPAPHHDIYSIEDLRQLVFSIKEATEYKKPVIVKVAAVHNIAAIASGIGPQRGGYHRHRRLPGRHRCGSYPHPGQRRHSDRACAGSGGSAAAGRGHPQQRVAGGRRQHPLGCRCGKSHCAGRRRLLYCHRGASGAGLPPLPHLPDRQMQLGHCHTAPRAGQASQSRPRLPAAGQSDARMAA